MRTENSASSTLDVPIRRFVPISSSTTRLFSSTLALRACLESGWHGLPARIRRQLAAEKFGWLVAHRNRPVACSTQNRVSKQALRKEGSVQRTRSCAPGIKLVLLLFAFFTMLQRATAQTSNDFFASGRAIDRIVIQVAEGASNSLRLRPREYVKSEVTEGATNFSNVGVHLKGNYGTFLPLERKPSLTLNFDKFAKAQNFHGLDKLHLNNSVSDPSFMTELLCRDLFRAAGMPSARVSHARVSINGTDRGLYVLVEGFDKTFLRRFFANPKGNLYDSEFLHDITDPLRRASGSGTNDHADLKALAAAAQEFAGRKPSPLIPLPSDGRGESTHLTPALSPADAEREKPLESILDMDRFYSFLALEVLTCHFDGYSRGKNNYWIYHDLTSDKMVFIPHGMDQMFTQQESSLFPEFKGMLARSLLATPEGRQRFRERCVTLFTNLLCPLPMNRSAGLRPGTRAMDQHAGSETGAPGAIQVFNARNQLRGNLSPGFAESPSPAFGTLSRPTGEGTSLSNKVVELQMKLRPEIASLGTNALAEHDRAVSNLQQRIATRIAHLRRHLLAPAPALTTLVPGAWVAITNWLPTVEGGMAKLSETSSPGGTNLLRIVMETPDRPALAGWEARVRLPSGKYQVMAPVTSELPIFRGPRSPMSLKIWGGEDVQFESTRPDPRHLELARTIAIPAEEEILIQCTAVSTGDPLALSIGPVVLHRLE